MSNFTAPFSDRFGYRPQDAEIVIREDAPEAVRKRCSQATAAVRFQGMSSPRRRAPCPAASLMRVVVSQA